MRKDVTSFVEFCRLTDWNLLREQKNTLAFIQRYINSPEDLTPKELDAILSEADDTIEGLLNFIDSIQDLAADHYGQPAYAKETK
jgi:hypothetical protein